MKTLIATLLAATFACAGAAAAQTYPDKPIHLIVPTAPGGGTDLIGRMVAQGLNAALGQPVVVENRGGAGTTIGTAIAARAAPDGYTLLLDHLSLAFNQSYYRHLPYNALTSFAPIGLVAVQPFLVVVHPSLPVHSIRELIALAKAHPGKIAYGSGGAGSGPFMATELFKQLAHVDLLQVPYKGAGPAFTDLMGGQVLMMIGTISLTLPQAKAGKVRALAVTSAKRVAAAPELPTVAEAGVPGYDFVTWYGLLAPAGTPPAIVERLNAETVKILAAPALQHRLAGMGLQTDGGSPQAFAATLKHDVAKWAKVVHAAGIYAR